MIDELLLFALVVILGAALPLSVIAALGFRNSPFGRVTVPLPFILVAYLLSDGIRVVIDDLPVVYYLTLTTAALVAIVYVAANAFLLLTERRSV